MTMEIVGRLWAEAESELDARSADQPFTPAYRNEIRQNRSEDFRQAQEQLFRIGAFEVLIEKQKRLIALLDEIPNDSYCD